MEIFYHGTSVLFKKFDLAHALEGDGKAKFGFGTYVTEAYTSAAHYAYNKKRPENKDYYVYSDFLSTDPPMITATGAKGDYQRYALSLMSSYGWEDTEMYALIQLWNRESGWNPNSHNKSSGAHGIPQALPGRKMASEGSDWATNGNTQIRWGLNYIRNRYGSPSNAWAHFQRSGWY